MGGALVGYYVSLAGAGLLGAGAAISWFMRGTAPD